jgi:hypothetical protein
MAIPTSPLWSILAFTEGLDISGWFDAATEGVDWSAFPVGAWGVNYLRDVTNKRIEIHDGVAFTQIYPVITAGSIGTGSWKTQIKFVPDVSVASNRIFTFNGGSPDSGLGNALALYWDRGFSLWNIQRELDIFGLGDIATGVDLTPVPGTTLDILMEYDSTSGLVSVTINGTLYGALPTFAAGAVAHDQSLSFSLPRPAGLEVQFIDEWLIGVPVPTPPPAPVIISSGGVSLADRPRRTLESVPSFESEAAPAIFGGNFEELFHSEFTEFVEAMPIMDVVAPGCPTNLSCIVNTLNRTMFFTWYWPSTYSSDGSIQNDVKEFEFFRFKDGEFSLITKTRIPKYNFYVTDDLLQESKDEGLAFAVRAVDFHDLVSKTSKTILVKLNKNYGCKEREIDPVFISGECGNQLNKKYSLNNKIILNKDQINLFVGTHIGIKEPFKNRDNTLLLTIKDLNTGKIFTINLTIQHNKLTVHDVVYGVANKTSDILSSIRRGTGRF